MGLGEGATEGEQYLNQWHSPTVWASQALERDTEGKDRENDEEEMIREKL